MLEKVPDIIVSPENPWHNDKLNRKQTAEVLTKLIETLSQPFVISINSPWGTGKTSFIRMWHQQLINDGHTSIYFNAWENDFSDNPFLTFIAELNSYIEAAYKEESTVSKELKTVKAKASQFFKKVGPIALKMATRGAINNLDELTCLLELSPKSDDDISNFLSTLLDNEINDYNAKKKSIKEFKKSLEKFSQSLYQDNPKKVPIIIFVDELDRCRPSFAVELLEKMKHLFNIERIVFVLAVDKDQLKCSIKTLYGNEMDANGYLRRFIDLQYEMETPIHIDIAVFLWSRFRLDECLTKMPPHRDGQQFKNLFLLVFSTLSKRMNLSIRDQIQCFTKLNLIFRFIGDSLHELGFLITLLVTLKFYDEDMYTAVLKQTIDPAVVLDLLNTLRVHETLDDDFRSQAYFEVMLSKLIMNKNDFKEMVRGWYETMSGVGDEPKKNLANERMKFYQSFKLERWDIHPLISNRIEITNKFFSG